MGSTPERNSDNPGTLPRSFPPVSKTGADLELGFECNGMFGKASPKATAFDKLKLKHMSLTKKGDCYVIVASPVDHRWPSLARDRDEINLADITRHYVREDKELATPLLRLSSLSGEYMLKFDVDHERAAWLATMEVAFAAMKKNYDWSRYNLFLVNMEASNFRDPSLLRLDPEVDPLEIILQNPVTHQDFERFYLRQLLSYSISSVGNVLCLTYTHNMGVKSHDCPKQRVSLKCIWVRSLTALLARRLQSLKLEFKTGQTKGEFVRIFAGQQMELSPARRASRGAGFPSSPEFSPIRDRLTSQVSLPGDPSVALYPPGSRPLSVGEVRNVSISPLPPPPPEDIAGFHNVAGCAPHGDSSGVRIDDEDFPQPPPELRDNDVDSGSGKTPPLPPAQMRGNRAQTDTEPSPRTTPALRSLRLPHRTRISPGGPAGDLISTEGTGHPPFFSQTLPPFSLSPGAEAVASPTQNAPPNTPAAPEDLSAAYENMAVADEPHHTTPPPPVARDLKPPRAMPRSSRLTRFTSEPGQFEKLEDGDSIPGTLPPRKASISRRQQLTPAAEETRPALLSSQSVDSGRLNSLQRNFPQRHLSDSATPRPPKAPSSSSSSSVVYDSVHEIEGDACAVVVHPTGTHYSYALRDAPTPTAEGTPPPLPDDNSTHGDADEEDESDDSDGETNARRQNPQRAVSQNLSINSGDILDNVNDLCLGEFTPTFVIKRNRFQRAETQGSEEGRASPSAVAVSLPVDNVTGQEGESD